MWRTSTGSTCAAPSAAGRTPKRANLWRRASPAALAFCETLFTPRGWRAPGQFPRTSPSTCPTTRRIRATIRRLDPLRPPRANSRCVSGAIRSVKKPAEIRESTRLVGAVDCFHTVVLCRIIENQNTERISSRLDANDDVALVTLQTIQQRPNYQAIGFEHVSGKDIARPGIEPLRVHTLEDVVSRVIRRPYRN